MEKKSETKESLQQANNNFLKKNEILILLQAIENGEIETIISYINDKDLKQKLEKLNDENRFWEERDNVENEYLANLASQIKKEDYSFLQARITNRASMSLICATCDTEYIKQCLNYESLELIDKVFLVSAIKDNEYIKVFLNNNISELESWQKARLIISTNDTEYIKECISNENLELEDSNISEMIIATKDNEYIKEHIESGKLNESAIINLIKATKDSAYIKDKIENSDLDISGGVLVNLLKVTNDEDLIKHYLDSDKLDISCKLEIIDCVKNIEYIDRFIIKNSNEINKSALMRIIAQTKESNYIYQAITNTKYGLTDKEKARIVLQSKDKDLIERYYFQAKDLSSEDKKMFEFILNPNDLKLEREEHKKINLPQGMTIGIEIETEGEYSQELPKTILDGHWKSKTDNSLEDGAEIVSTILTGSEQDSKEIYQICDFLEDIGQSTSERCGAHVHIGADYLTNKQAYINLLEIFGNTEEIIYAISNESNSSIRKGISKYCLPIASKLEEGFEKGSINSKEDLSKFIEQLQIIQGDRYSGINFMNIGTSKNTIEFRTPNGTIEPDVWIENINLFGGIVKAAQDISLIQQKDIQELTQEDKEKLMYFSRIKSQNIDLSQKLYALLSLAVDDKDPYMERYSKNIGLMQQDEEIQETMKKAELKTPLDIRSIGKNVFTGEEAVRGEEVTGIESTFYRDIEQVREGEKSYE